MVSLHDASDNTDISHAVLYDHAKTAKAANNLYYFKNSNPNEPWITVPKNRATFEQHTMVKACEQMNMTDPSRLGNQLKSVLRPEFIDISPQTMKTMFQEAVYPAEITFDGGDHIFTGQKHWTINDRVFAICIQKK